MGIADLKQELDSSNIDMILYKPSLFIKRLIVSQAGTIAYDEKFHYGVNIIRGENGSGKSTISDFLFFVLGGDLNVWKVEAESCDYVLAEVELNDVSITLRRHVSALQRQGMDVFFGPYEQAIASAINGWQRYPFQRSANKESFSQLLFANLNIPEADVDNSILTMHQLLRLLYVDQLSQGDVLLRNEKFDSALTRTTIESFFFGAYDNALYQYEAEVKKLTREYEDEKHQYEGMLSILREAKSITDLEQISKRIKENEERIDKLESAIKLFDSTMPGDISIHAKDEITELKKNLIDLRQKINFKEKEEAQSNWELADSQLFIASLKNRLCALDDAIMTRKELGILPINVCPLCLSELGMTSTVPDGCCHLCKNNISSNANNSTVLRMKNEINIQIRESEKIFSDREKYTKKISLEIISLRDQEHDSSVKLNGLLSKISSKRDQERDNMLSLQGELRGQLSFLRAQRETILRLASLDEDIRSKESSITQINKIISSLRNSQQKRMSTAIKCIEDEALVLVKADLPREGAFINPKSVSCDFAKNTFALDGCNQFSASSVVYLKNCIHFAIFFSSLKLDFMRYPRLIICDNIEDKGMEAVRSQNFQVKIVERASYFKDVKHQIIFTTSMIAPDLNNTELCVGEEYMKSNKTLKLSPPNKPSEGFFNF